MIAKPQPTSRRPLSFLTDSGTSNAKLRLLAAVYRDETETARRLIISDPDQINEQDPYSGLTSLHIAIFRQNRDIVDRLIHHRQTDLKRKDNFDRSIVDMLDYTSDQTILDWVIEAYYPEQVRQLNDAAYEQGRSSGTIIPLNPRQTPTDDDEP